MLVRELMTPDPVTVAEDTPVKTALVLLSRHEITSMPVLGRHGRVSGVVSEADLIRDLVRADPRSHELTLDDEWLDRPVVVGEVMTPHAVTVHPDTELAQAVDLITSTTVKSVPVVDQDGGIKGMLSRSDVVRVLARADEELARDVDSLLTSVGLGDWVAEVTDGSVTLTGPDDARERALAHLVAGTVPGVVQVSCD
jgi:CBS-domain-containing membrane protein